MFEQFLFFDVSVIHITLKLFSSKGRCIGQPQLCTNGMSMIFWAKFDQSIRLQSSASEPKKYVFSSGGSDYRSQGYSLYKEYSNFMLKVASATHVWKIFIPIDQIPVNSWFSFAFTWPEGTCRIFLL